MQLIYWRLAIFTGIILAIYLYGRQIVKKEQLDYFNGPQPIIKKQLDYTPFQGIRVNRAGRDVLFVNGYEYEELEISYKEEKRGIELAQNYLKSLTLIGNFRFYGNRYACRAPDGKNTILILRGEAKDRSKEKIQFLSLLLDMDRELVMMRMISPVLDRMSEVEG